MPVLKSAQLPLLMFLCVSLFAGCCATRKSAPPTCCASVAKPASRAVPNEGSTIVTSQFSQIGEYVSTKLITGDDAIGQTGFLTLEETICIAAENSAKANLLESQLVKLNQSPVDGFEKPQCRETLNRSIRSQIIEERNRTASLAAQLFLGLVEIDLQRTLLVESQERLSKIKATIEEAKDEGFATANPRALLAKQSVLVAEKESTLHYNDQKIRAQLAALLDADPTVQLEVSYDLRPAPHYVDLPTEQATALSTRAELVELQYMLANWNECTTDLGNSILALADPRMQVQLAKIRQVVERSWLWFFLGPKEEEQRDPCEESQVREQTQQYFENSRAAVFLSIKLAALDMQNSFEQMVISDDEIKRLEQRVEQISASRDIDATQAYIDLQENWYQTLLARSERISNAIKYESAQVRLAEATGELAQMCGFGENFGNDCSCR